LIRCVQILSNLIRCCHTRQHDQLPHHSHPIWSGICTYPEIYSTSSSFSCISIRCMPILSTMLTYLIFFIKFDQVCVNTQQFAQLPHLFELGQVCADTLEHDHLLMVHIQFDEWGVSRYSATFSTTSSASSNLIRYCMSGYLATCSTISSSSAQPMCQGPFKIHTNLLVCLAFYINIRDVLFIALLPFYNNIKHCLVSQTETNMSVVVSDINP
jgi:hypothetical protein